MSVRAIVVQMRDEADWLDRQPVRSTVQKLQAEALARQDRKWADLLEAAMDHEIQDVLPGL